MIEEINHWKSRRQRARRRSCIRPRMRIGVKWLLLIDTRVRTRTQIRTQIKRLIWMAISMSMV